MASDGARNLPGIVLDVLADVERAESQLLAWGVVEGAFTRNELVALVQNRLSLAFDAGEPVPYGGAGEVIDVLLDHSLIFELPRSHGDRFRSRTAETIRLFSRLKQILPKHARPGGWRDARDLVADYRVILRPRLYPKRDLNLKVVEERLAQTAAWSDADSRVLRELISNDLRESLLLADFQVEATEQVLREAAVRTRSTGTIVCAGTGSGKTLAFYLPALLELGRLAGPDRWTRCLALYPRNELLKDQLSSALVQVRKLNRILTADGRFSVTIGALFGDVPRNCDDDDTLRRTWTRVGGGSLAGWACPYLTCPKEGCQHSSLVWRDSDRREGIERLSCDRSGCGCVLDASEFILTRASMNQGCPDLLFTGVEMVNKSMSSVRTSRLLGVGTRADQRPRLILLDEAHTYDDAYGAHVALLLRRWKRASKARPHFVGLSATLEDASRFFSVLIGESELAVREVSPRVADLEPQGREVLLALRGDPVSKTSLLSTSIQAAMLLRRTLDPVGTVASLFGTKLFAFTDDLDVTNRLYHNLLDAEGWMVVHGGIQPRQGPPLATYRDPRADEHWPRYQAGQSWDLVESIGHELGSDPVVRVGRTSSQDSGVDRHAETVVATASLEVGFDDPEVGAVLQHKAPRSAANFLQRKGRAGRPRGTYPWTVVVLSDYGRDRLAYQGYDQLFSPQIRPRYLPVKNRHILRMQAVFALMDWLTLELKDRHSDGSAWLWPVLSGPPLKGPYLKRNEERLDQLVSLVTELLQGESRAGEFARYLQQALAVGSDQVQMLLWEPPRSLMLSVLPTIVRRLGRRWQAAVLPGAQARLEPMSPWSPLPEFVPAALFSDLNLPEVSVSLPPHGDGDIESMPVRKALQEFSPGRVSRRFGVVRQRVCHWIPVPVDHSSGCLVEDLCGLDGFDELGVFRSSNGNEEFEVACLRPRRLFVQEPPGDIGVTSNARVLWSSQILPRVKLAQVELPSGSAWSALIRSVGFAAHVYGNSVEIRRFALGSRFDIRTSGGEAESGEVLFARRTDDGIENVALGYAMDADAMCIEVELPAELHRQVQTNPELSRALRTAYFAYRVETDPALDGIANHFERGWLVQVCLSAFLLEAVERDVPLERAADNVFAADAGAPFEKVLNVIFHAAAEDQEHGHNEDDRRAELLLLLKSDLVIERMADSATSLWEDLDPSWDQWLRARFLSTLGAAVLEACQQLCMEVDSADLCLDVSPGPRGPRDGCAATVHDEIWLSETSPGGSGVIEAVSSAYTRDPLRFFRLVEASLAPSDFEEVDVELTTLVSWLASDAPSYRPEVADAVRATRAAETHHGAITANEELRGRLERAGLAVTHPVLVAMQARLLRPRSSPRTDSLLFDMVERWRHLEERLGVEVDARVVAYTMSNDQRLDDALTGVCGAPIGPGTREWRYGTLYGLLWPRGATVRSQMLSAYNPFAVLPATDRWLVLAAVPATTTEVSLDSPSWHADLCKTLVDEGTAVLSAAPERRYDLRRAIQQMLVNSLDTDAMLIHPCLTSVSQERHRLRARFEVREGFQ